MTSPSSTHLFTAAVVYLLFSAVFVEFVSDAKADELTCTLDNYPANQNGFTWTGSFTVDIDLGVSTSFPPTEGSLTLK
jgi:hypothetical protein